MEDQWMNIREMQRRMCITNPQFPECDVRVASGENGQTSPWKRPQSKYHGPMSPRKGAADNVLVRRKPPVPKSAAQCALHAPPKTVACGIELARGISPNPPEAFLNMVVTSGDDPRAPLTASSVNPCDLPNLARCTNGGGSVRRRRGTRITRSPSRA